MASEDTYTEHLHDPATQVRGGVTWPRFAILAGLLMVVFWVAL
jgi:hypothetical protein